MTNSNVPVLPDGRANPDFNLDLIGRKPIFADRPKRPRMRDNAVVNRAIDLHYKTMFSGQLHTTADLDPGAKMKQFRDAMTFKMEPYHQARFLDDKGWIVDANTVRDLDWFNQLLAAVHNEVVAEWVLKNGVRFPGKEGDTITGKPIDEDFTIIGVCQGTMKDSARALIAVNNWAGANKLYFMHAEDVISSVKK